MKPLNLNMIYQNIMQEAELARKNKADLPINELMKKPPFSGFIEIAHLKDISASMFLAQNDDGVALRCLWNGNYEPMTTALWAALCKDASCILDVGAHTGLYSLIAHAANPAAAVISIEPFPLNFARLLLNLRSNDHSADFALNMAVSNQTGDMHFSVSTGAGYLSTGGKISSSSEDNSFPVKATTLEEIVENTGARLDLIKIDVEGHEHQVLQGGLTVLDDRSPDLIFESAFSQNTGALEALLVRRGYRFYIIYEDKLTLESVTHLRPTSSDTANMNSLNRFATKRDDEEILKFEALAQNLSAKS